MIPQIKMNMATNELIIIDVIVNVFITSNFINPYY